MFVLLQLLFKDDCVSSAMLSIISLALCRDLFYGEEAISLLIPDA